MLEQAIAPKKSGTFRKGQPGNWREHFSEANKAFFKENAGDLLIRLGYEKDHDWYELASRAEVPGAPAAPPAAPRAVRRTALVRCPPRRSCSPIRFPKSGTHLLTQVMQGFTRLGPAVDSGLPAVVTFDGFTGRQRRLDEILADLRPLPTRRYRLWSRTCISAEAVDLLCQRRVMRPTSSCATARCGRLACPLCRPRWPPTISTTAITTKSCNTFDERAARQHRRRPELRSWGKPTGGKPALEPLPDIRRRFEPFFGWLERPEVLVLRYEDFITASAGLRWSRCSTMPLTSGFQAGTVERSTALQDSVRQHRPISLADFPQREDRRLEGRLHTRASPVVRGDSRRSYVQPRLRTRIDPESESQRAKALQSSILLDRHSRL